MTLEPSFLKLAACPQCHAPLRESDPGAEPHEAVCTSPDCGLAYPVRDGIPVLLVEDARKPA